VDTGSLGSLKFRRILLTLAGQGLEVADRAPKYAILATVVRVRMNEARNSLFWLILAAAAALMALAAKADNFGNIRYDKQTDQLVVTMIYRGTNPDHGFSLKWGPCQANQSDNLPGATAEVLDDQYEDAAQEDFSKTVRFSLGDMPCARPANVTLRTAPRFFYTLTIPK
jgi:hypothetical protein